jgi:vesicle coat complex subunit
MSNLSRISQLTGELLLHVANIDNIQPRSGFSDPIYAEAYVKMHGFDILLGLQP